MAEQVAPSADVPYPNVWFVPQWRTEQILRSRWRHGVRLGSALGWPRSNRTKTGSSWPGSDQTLRAAYLVGADGGRSTVQATCGAVRR